MSDVKDAALVIGYQAQVGQGRVLTFQTGVAVDCKPEELSVIVDKLVNEANRQDAKLSLDLIQANIVSEEKMLKGKQEAIRKVSEQKIMAWRTSGKKGEYEPSSRDRRELEDLDVQIFQAQQRIKDLLASADTVRSKINGRLD